jgi:hypothetical protein
MWLRFLPEKDPKGCHLDDNLRRTGRRARQFLVRASDEVENGNVGEVVDQYGRHTVRTGATMSREDGRECRPGNRHAGRRSG